MDIFKQRLKQLVVDSGLSEAEFARRLGLGERRFNYYTSGGRGIRLEMVEQICVEFKTHPNWLFGWSDHKEPPREDRLAELERQIQDLHKRVNRR